MKTSTPALAPTLLKGLIPAIYALLVLFPLGYIIMSSFKTTDQIFSAPWSLPVALDLSIYADLLIRYKLAQGLFNSLFYAIASGLIVIVISTAAAYALVRMKFRLNGLFMLLIMLGLMIPVHSEMVPLYILFSALGLHEPRIVLTSIYTAFSIPVTTLLLASYIRSIPIALEESAVIDGSSLLGAFVRIVVPILQPAIATAAIFHFLGVWNDFFSALVFISSENDRTLQLATSVFRGAFSANYQYLLGGVVISIVPITAIYLLLQDRIIEGLTAGAVKG